MACSSHAGVVQPWIWVRTGILTVFVRMSLWLLIGGRLVTVANRCQLKILGDNAESATAKIQRLALGPLHYHVTGPITVI